MKLQSIIFLVFIVLFVGCSKEHKAKNAIKEELRLTLHDWKSYEPVQFGKLEVAFSSWEDNPMIEAYFKVADTWMESYKELSDKASSAQIIYAADLYYNYQRLASKSLDSVTFYMNKAERLKVEFKPEVIGWQLTHSYRAKNLAGNLGIHHYLFTLNKDCSKVLKSIDISENQK